MCDNVAWRHVDGRRQMLGLIEWTRGNLGTAIEQRNTVRAGTAAEIRLVQAESYTRERTFRECTKATRRILHARSCTAQKGPRKITSPVRLAGPEPAASNQEIQQDPTIMRRGCGRKRLERILTVTRCGAAAQPCTDAGPRLHACKFENFLKAEPRLLGVSATSA